MSSSTWRALLGGLLLTLAGCGPVPAPFKQTDEAKASNPLLALPDSAGITVAPPAEGPSALTGPLAERTAERLRWAGLPASTGGALTEGYLLEGAARWANGAAIVAWRLSDREGTVVATPEVRAAADEASFNAGSDPLIAALAARGAEAVSKAIRTPAAGPATPNEAEEPVTAGDGVFVLPVEGPAAAPARELGKALRALLDDIGVPRAETEAAAGLLIQGVIEDEAAGDTPATDARPLAIEWLLLAPDGAVIGSMRQQNAMAGDPARTGFGGTAYDIALPVAEAIRDALGN